VWYAAGGLTPSPCLRFPIFKLTGRYSYTRSFARTETRSKCPMSSRRHFSRASKRYIIPNLAKTIRYSLIVKTEVFTSRTRVFLSSPYRFV
jgi:hypothetical protein